MDISFLKNPIILAILAAVITYAYMYWETKKQQEKNPKVELPPVGYFTPMIVGLMTLVIGYGFFGFKTNGADDVGVVIENGNVVEHNGGASVSLLGGKPGRMVERMTDSFDSNTFHLVGKNAIKLPQTDVFIDIAKF